MKVWEFLVALESNPFCDRNTEIVFFDKEGMITQTVELEPEDIVCADNTVLYLCLDRAITKMQGDDDS